MKLDLRGLEPPQPLVRVLEALAQLPSDGGIEVRTDRRPMHLYAQLERRGFAWKDVEQPDGSHVTQIHRCN
jgi:uncharacterized protein (DUF2249 family)